MLGRGCGPSEPVNEEPGRAIDWPLLLVEGQGRVCGVHLHVWNRWADLQPPADDWWYGRWERKTIDWWWGEGDEKFFVDGEKFPSTFGTGSEDYIGYAWAAEQPFPTFDSAYVAQSRVPIDGNGHTEVCRFHICGDVPVQSSFEGYIEGYKGNRWGSGNVCEYATVAYWYQRPGRRDPYEPVPLSERVGYDVEPGARRAATARQGTEVAMWVTAYSSTMWPLDRSVTGVLHPVATPLRYCEAWVLQVPRRR